MRPILAGDPRPPTGVVPGDACKDAPLVAWLGRPPTKDAISGGYFIGGKRERTISLVLVWSKYDR